MYENGYSIAIVLDHRSTAISLTGNRPCPDSIVFFMDIDLKWSVVTLCWLRWWTLVRHNKYYRSSSTNVLLYHPVLAEIPALYTLPERKHNFNFLFLSGKPGHLTQSSPTNTLLQRQRNFRKVVYQKLHFGIDDICPLIIYEVTSWAPIRCWNFCFPRMFCVLQWK